MEDTLMDWPKIISEILWMEEITEKELCTSLTVPITASALNRLKKGHTKIPLYHLGHALVQRHKKLIRQHQQNSHQS